jgi:hypothetical protein
VIINGNLATIRRVLLGALAGFLAAAVALGLVAGITGPLSSPVVAVGGVAIDVTPIPLKDFAIAHFGSNDKNVLVLGIVVQLALFALLIGALAVRWLAAGLAGLAVFGALGVSAVVTRPSAGFADALPTLIGVGVAAVAMVFLVEAARADPSRRVRPGRRRFLALSAGAALVAVTAGGAGEVLLRRFNVSALRAAVRLPAPAVRAPAVPAGTALPIAGITPFYTSDNSFYRVDTDLVVPQVSPQEWTLRITGMVDHPIELSFDDLLRLPLIEHDMTLVCVSNQVGGRPASSGAPIRCCPPEPTA